MAADAERVCRIVLTGGPGGGKTAALEVARRHFRGRAEVLPETATILFGGGFPRRTTTPARCSAQRAILRVQRELERLADEESPFGVVLCDRGTLDGLAYWPGEDDALLAETETSRARELARYTMVLHLRPSADRSALDGSNPVRIEDPAEAMRIDARIERAWQGHPRRFFVESTPDFLAKVGRVLGLIEAEVTRWHDAARASRLAPFQL